MASSWFWTKQGKQIGAVLDVGNGWVEAALVLSDPSKSAPEPVWTYGGVFSDAEGGETGLKKAVFDAFGELSQNGFRELKRRGLSGGVSLIQASIHAPFAYTVARNVSVRSEKPFRVTRALVKELETRAEADARTMLSSELMSKSLRLHPLSSAAAGLSLNGYQTKYPFKSAGSELSLCQHISLSSVDFLALLAEARDKYLPKVPVDADSYISLLYRTISSLSPRAGDALVVTVDQGATEFLAIWDLLPQNASFMTKGVNDLAADGRAYEDELKALLRRAGETFSLPKTIFVQTDRRYEATFASVMEKAAREVTGTKHSVRPVTSEFFGADGGNDASLLCLAYVFHKKLYEDDRLDV